jgi:hypothetical protein
MSGVSQILGPIAGAATGWLLGRIRNPIGKRRPIYTLWDQLQRPKLAQYFEREAREAKRIRMVGTGLALLMDNDPLRREIEDRGRDKRCQLEIYLADPLSPSVEDRLVEEELPLGEGKPKVGQQGLERFLRTLLDERAQRRTEDGHEPFLLKLFSHYPTFALMILDDKYFFYPYGYALLGNFSPVFELWKGRSDPQVIQFLEKHYERVRASAVDAATVVSVRNNNRIPAGTGIRNLAVYFVPAVGTPLYDFGSYVLGFDLRTQAKHGNPKPSPWEQQVGAAKQFGFHLTICDALGFLSGTAPHLVTAIVEMLARQLAPFELTELNVKESYPDARAIAVAAVAPTGELEVLHNELVHSVYRRALTSNYSTGEAGAARDNHVARNRLMTGRYLAPYIMQRFQPHFTLLCDVDPQQQTALASQLRQELKARGVPDSVRVDQLAVMMRADGASQWEIIQEVRLGGK